MGLSKDIRAELEKWLERTKIAYDKLEKKVKVLEGKTLCCVRGLKLWSAMTGGIA